MKRKKNMNIRIGMDFGAVAALSRPASCSAANTSEKRVVPYSAIAFSGAPFRRQMYAATVPSNIRNSVAQ